MSTWELSEDQQRLQAGAIAFARAALTASGPEEERAGHFDHEGWKKCADFGVLGMPIPEAYGGQGLGLSELLAVMEGLGYGTRDQGLLFSINAHLWTNSIPILIYGKDEQRTRYLPGLCDGSLIGANGASEPDAGSDIFSMRTRAAPRRRPLRAQRHQDVRHATRRSPTSSSPTRRSIRRSAPWASPRS